ncbi:MAG: hypothetical protein WB646_03160, partial [Steroidobacteraceae bacterium]
VELPELLELLLLELLLLELLDVLEPLLGSLEVLDEPSFDEPLPPPPQLANAISAPAESARWQETNRLIFVATSRREIILG